MEKFHAHDYPKRPLISSTSSTVREQKRCRDCGEAFVSKNSPQLICDKCLRLRKEAKKSA